MAPARVNFGLVHNKRFDLSVLLMGSTSSDGGQFERLGFQVTYLLGENCEKKVFFPCFLKLDQALSQSVEYLSPERCAQGNLVRVILSWQWLNSNAIQIKHIHENELHGQKVIYVCSRSRFLRILPNFRIQIGRETSGSCVLSI